MGSESPISAEYPWSSYRLNGAGKHIELLAPHEEYPWSSYRLNGAGKHIELLAPHEEYLRLGNSDLVRQEAYRQLFEGRMEERDIESIRLATNKCWALGDERFIRQIEAKTGGINGVTH